MVDHRGESGHEGGAGMGNGKDWRPCSTRAWLTAVSVAASFALLAVPLSTASGQTLDEAVRAALDNNCSMLGAGPTSGPFGPNLTKLCFPNVGGGGVPGSPTTSTAGSVTTQTRLGVLDEERRALLRLEEKHEATAAVMAASADTSSLRGLSLFGSVEYEAFDKDLTRFEPGYTSDSLGGVIGADYSFRNLTVGGAFTYVHVDGSFDQSGGDFDTNSYGLLLYGSVTPIPNLFVDVAGGYTRRDYSFDRTVVFGLINGQLRSDRGQVSGDTDGNEYRVAVSVGYDFVLSRFTIGPRVGVNYRHTTVDSFTEHGSTGLELAYERQHEDSLVSILGLHGSAALSTRFGVFLPQTTVEWLHEYERDQRVIYFRFAEDFGRTKLRFQNDPPDRNYFNVNIGVVLVLPSGLLPFVNYRTLLGYHDQSSHTVTVGLRLSF
jgi:outer membrane autotransporter protein